VFTFLWKHKIFSLFLIGVCAYFFVNPAHKFGYCQKNLVVFNRLPVSFFDLSISVNGSAKLLENLNNKDALTDFFNELSAKPDDETVFLIVGTGFKSPLFVLSDEKIVSLGGRNITVKQVPSKEAVNLYNSSVDQGKKAALLLAIKH
jgi:hypothetical protein